MAVTVLGIFFVLLLLFSGKHRSSYFEVQTSVGTTRTIQARYNGRRLRSGDLVHVTFLQYNGTLLHLTILSAENQGWELRESDGRAGDCSLIGMGLLMAFVGWWFWRTLPS